MKYDMKHTDYIYYNLINTIYGVENISSLIFIDKDVCNLAYDNVIVIE